MARIAVDMDGVIANYVKKQFAFHQRLTGFTLSHKKLNGQKLRHYVPEDIGNKITAHMNEESFFLDLEVISNSQQVLKELQKEHEIYIATAAVEFPLSFNAKYQWLKKHFSFINDTHIVFCGDKSVIHTDYLIDDQPYNLQAFKGKGILFSAYHNLNNNEFERVNDWEEVSEYFKRISV